MYVHVCVMYMYVCALVCIVYCAQWSSVARLFVHLAGTTIVHCSVDLAESMGYVAMSSLYGVHACMCVCVCVCVCVWERLTDWLWNVCLFKFTKIGVTCDMDLCLLRIMNVCWLCSVSLTSSGTCSSSTLQTHRRMAIITQTGMGQVWKHFISCHLRCCWYVVDSVVE